ncbi:MAG TPA: gamma-glutamyl-gamma-aminobutyrate hydrolase family protein [Gemmatimonadales bacterium]|jgi:putative glutamine amidotransferase|nr:gamma-glutamyl-gamma-aminobutyrate hydrolase family protein [Gemmatimonadales bacterium]
MNGHRVVVSGVVRHWDGLDRTGVGAAYVSALIAQGLLPVIGSPLVPEHLAALLLEDAAGLLLTGGEDVDPVHYGAMPSPALGAVSRARDAFEFALFREARARDLPVLAICRGIQVVNVALGGTLWQDLPSERPGDVAHDVAGNRAARTHRINVAVSSRLHAALDASSCSVNSRHHQAVRDLAPGLVATAWSEDGLIEGVEADSGAWLVGVQWHPEDLADADGAAPDRGIFRAFRDAISARPVAA